MAALSISAAAQQVQLCGHALHPALTAHVPGAIHSYQTSTPHTHSTPPYLSLPTLCTSLTDGPHTLRLAVPISRIVAS